MRIWAMKKQTQTNPISPTPKGVKQKSDAACQMNSLRKVVEKC